MTVCRADYAAAMEHDAVAVFYNPLKPRNSVIYWRSRFAIRDRYGEPIADPAPSARKNPVQASFVF